MINIDFSKSHLDNIIALARANNSTEMTGHTLDATNVSIGAPSVFDDEATNPGANSQITITALQDKGYSGDRTVSYYRPTVGEISTTPGTLPLVDTSDAVSDTAAYEARVKAMILAQYGLPEDEIVFGTVPVPGSENDTVYLEVTPTTNNPLLQGAAFQAAFAAQDQDVALDTVIVNTSLSGFTY